MENKMRFVRSRKNRQLAGVCAGLSDYFNFDVSLMRVLFVVAALCGSFGLWLYIILWIVVPEEQPTIGFDENEHIDILRFYPCLKVNFQPGIFCVCQAWHNSNG